MTTVFKEGLWVAKNSDILVENKVKIGSTVSNRIRPDTFQPLGRASSRARTNRSTSNDKETTSGHANKNHMTKTERECSSDFCMKEGIEIHKKTLPEVVKSKDETMPTCESDQRHRTERANRWSHETNDISERMNLNGPQSSDLLIHEVLWKKSVPKEADAYYCGEKKEIIDADSPTASDRS